MEDVETNTEPGLETITYTQHDDMHSLTGTLLSSPEKTKKKVQKGGFRTPVGSKRITIGSRIELETYTTNREREVLILSLSCMANRRTSEISNS